MMACSCFECVSRPGDARTSTLKNYSDIAIGLKHCTRTLRGEWPSGLYSIRQVTEVKLRRVRSDFGWVTSEA